MKPIAREDMLAFADWERVRNVLRPLFIHEKDRRRLTVGAHLTLLFENTQTLWYQVEEMLRVERITEPEAIQHEIDTYNELIPGSGELSATLMIAFGDPHERDAALKQLVGLERHLWLRLGERRVAAKFDERQMSPERLSSVQFVRIPVGLDSDAFLALAAAGKVALVVDHPYLGAEAPISGALAIALAEDLRPAATES
jgi:hypothetical protein